MVLIDYVVTETLNYIQHMKKNQRKQYGQFFTSKKTAIFMAGLFNIPQNQDTISILDPGAGAGILSAALIERLENVSYINKIELVCYENDLNIIKLLKTNLDWICNHSKKKIDYKIFSDNYITSQKQDYNHLLGENNNPQKFDLIIANPPYMKIAKNAPEAKAMSDVCYGTPNLYFLFATMSLFNLKENAEMVYIIPRSWTSGAYFKRFRQKILNESVLQHIHLFINRDKVFEEERVLQETIIIKLKKTTDKHKNITITTTKNNSDFSDITLFKAPYDIVVSGKETYVYLVTNNHEIQSIRQLKLWNNTLQSIGLKMKTGLTVDFRNRDKLRNYAEESTVPLFYSQHIQNGDVIFPIGKENEYIVANQLSLLQPNKNYLFIKRFTSKEEHRRLQCGVYLARKYPNYTNISTQNKINFIDGMNDLSECIVYGLYVLFNSTLYDCYYRVLNGSTQVNSTEINSMPVPPLECIERMGKKLIKLQDMTETGCDQILRSFIYEQNRGSKRNTERVTSAS